MTPLYYDYAASLGYLTITTNRLMGARLNRCFAAAGLPVKAEQWSALGFLWNTPGLNQEEMAQALCLDKSSLSRLLDGLERKGYIRRERDPADARRKRVFPTQAADALRLPCLAIVMENLRQVQAGIPAEDLALCRNVLECMQRNIREEQALQRNTA